MISNNGSIKYDEFLVMSENWKDYTLTVTLKNGLIDKLEFLGPKEIMNSRFVLSNVNNSLTAFIDLLDEFLRDGKPLNIRINTNK